MTLVRVQLTPRLIGGDDDVGGDEKGAILCRRYDVISLVPDPVVQAWNEAVVIEVLPICK